MAKESKEKNTDRTNSLLMAANMVFFAIYVLTYEFLVLNYNMGNSISRWRYYILAFVTIFSSISLLFVKRHKKLIGKELLLMFIPAVLFLIFSFYKASVHDSAIHLRTFVQISMFLLPAIYAFNIINIFPREKIILLMEFAAVATIIMYFCEPKHTILQFFNPDNWVNISFLRSTSFTESHNFFDSFLQLFLFFFFFKDLVKNEKQKKTMSVFSKIMFVFAFISFKRLGILFLIFMLCFGNKLKNKTFKKNHALIVAVIVTIITVIYTKILQGELLNFDYDTLFNITSGRKWFLDIWAKTDYISYGYGTSMEIIGRFIEMDFVEIYLELNMLCLFAFAYCLLKIPKKSQYSTLILIYVVSNMLTSSSLPWTFGFIVMYATAALIGAEKEQALLDGGADNES